MRQQRKPKIKALPELCAAVRSLRVALDMSQEKFAQATSIHTQTISRFERGAQVPTDPRVLLTFQRLAERMQLHNIAGLMKSALRDLPEQPREVYESLLEGLQPLIYTHDEWRLMQVGLLAVRFFPEIAKAIEGVAGPVLMIVDGGVRAAKIPEKLDATFYRELEKAILDLANRQRLSELQKEASHEN